MPRPTVPAVSEFWYDELAVSQPGDESRDWPFLRLLGGLGAAFGRLHDVVRDTADGPGWSVLLDPSRCPSWALPWLAQFAGVRLTPDAGEVVWREEIISPPAFRRGTVDAMRDAVARTLTGTRYVRVVERTSSAYTLTVVTRTSETPDAALSELAALSQKPAGMVLTFATTDGPVWDEATVAWDDADPAATWDSVTLADVT